MENIDPQDELRAENALLKLKLEMDHGMGPNNTENLSPELENQWLRYIYDFKRLSKETAKVKIYDLIGRPLVTPLAEIQPDQVADALETLEKLMHEKGIALDCCCDYDAAVIYKFITEELFEFETKNFGLPGGVTHFSYEEFHPNHDYDIRYRIADFVKALLRGRWEHQFDGIWLASPVMFHGKDWSPNEITSMIHAFQEANAVCKLNELQIDSVAFNLKTNQGSAAGSMCYSTPNGGHFDGAFQFELSLIDQWEIAGIKMPGFGQ